MCFRRVPQDTGKTDAEAQDAEAQDAESDVEAQTAEKKKKKTMTKKKNCVPEQSHQDIKIHKYFNIHYNETTIIS